MSERVLIDRAIAARKQVVDQLRQSLLIHEKVLAELEAVRAELSGSSCSRTDIAAFLVDLIKQAGGSMKLSDIVREVRLRGLIVGTPRQATKMVYGTMTKRPQQFSRVGRATYTLKTD